MIPVIYLPIVIFTWFFNTIHQISWELISVAIGAAMGGLVPFLVSWHLNIKREREKRQAIKCDFYTSVVSRNWLYVINLYQLTFSASEMLELEIANLKELEELFEQPDATKQQRAIIDRVYKLFNEEKQARRELQQQTKTTKATQFNLFSNQEIQSLYSEFTKILQCLKEIRAQYLNAIAYLGNEFNEIGQLLILGQYLENNHNRKQYQSMSPLIVIAISAFYNLIKHSTNNDNIDIQSQEANIYMDSK